MVMTYLMEFHSARYKPRFTTWTGFLFAIANIIPAGKHAIAQYPLIVLINYNALLAKANKDVCKDILKTKSELKKKFFNIIVKYLKFIYAR